MVRRASVIDEVLGDPHGLIRKSLEPQDARVVGMRDDTLIELVADDLRPASAREVGSPQGLHATPCTGLVSQNVQDGTDESAADERIGWVGRLGRESAELPSEGERATIVAGDEPIHV